MESSALGPRPSELGIGKVGDGMACFTPPAPPAGTSVRVLDQRLNRLLRGHLFWPQCVILPLSLYGFGASVHFVLGHCTDSPEKQDRFPLCLPASSQQICQGQGT